MMERQDVLTQEFTDTTNSFPYYEDTIFIYPGTPGTPRITEKRIMNEEEEEIEITSSTQEVEDYLENVPTPIKNKIDQIILREKEQIEDRNKLVIIFDERMGKVEKKMTEMDGKMNNFQKEVGGMEEKFSILINEMKEDRLERKKRDEKKEENMKLNENDNQRIRRLEALLESNGIGRKTLPGKTIPKKSIPKKSNPKKI